MKNIFTLLLLAVSITESIAQDCNQLDPGFGHNGRVTGMSITNDWLNSGSVLVQPDNKIIQVSSSNTGGVYVSGIRRTDNLTTPLGTMAGRLSAWDLAITSMFRLVHYNLTEKLLWWESFLAPGTTTGTSCLYGSMTTVPWITALAVVGM